MKSVFEEYMSNQNVWKTYGNLALFENEKRLTDEYVIRPVHANGKLKVLEAGTGSGRIAFRIREKADILIDAFDFVPAFIEQAEMTRHQNGLDIRFFVKNATDLSGLETDGYDVLIYLQQLLCHIPKEELSMALSECARVCRQGGLLLLSYADYDNRSLDRLLAYLLAAVRFLRRDPLGRQELPYLHTNSKKGRRILNLSYFGSHQSVIYWFRRDELEAALAAAGFEVIQRLDELKRIVYLVCRKR